MNNELKNTEKIIYKGIEITLENGYYTFTFRGYNYINTNIHMTKRMITRDLKFYNSLK
jgi:hypothetical protein